MTPDALYLDDREIAKRLGISEVEWRHIAAFWESRKGLPPRQARFGGKRYWPAVKAFLDRENGLAAPSVLTPDGREDWSNEQRSTRTKAAAER